MAETTTRKRESAKGPGVRVLRHRAPSYGLYLAIDDLQHHATHIGSPKTNGFVERTDGTVLAEFFRPKMRETFYEGVDALQVDLDVRFHHDNREHPHLGYRDQSRRRRETIGLSVSRGV